MQWQSRTLQVLRKRHRIPSAVERPGGVSLPAVRRADQKRRCSMNATLYQRTLAACKLWARRLALRWARKLVDLADDRLHAAEVRFRDEVARPAIRVESPRLSTSECGRGDSLRRQGTPRRESFQQWEARRSGVALVSKKEARRRRALTAREFDLRFAERGNA